MRIQYVRTNEKELHIQNSLMSFFRKQTKPNSRFLYVHDFLFFWCIRRVFFFFVLCQQVLTIIYLNHKTCTRWRRWVNFSDKGESDVDNRNKRNKPTLSADAIQPWVPGFGLNRILEEFKINIKSISSANITFRYVWTLCVSSCWGSILLLAYS